MTSKCLSAVLIVAFGLALARPAQGQQKCVICGQIGPSAGPIIAGVAGAAVGPAVVVWIVVHESRKKRMIMGCVVSETNGMTLTDEKDRLNYTLAGDTAGIKPGDRVKLQGKKVNSKDPYNPRSWETRALIRDYGVCQP